MISSQLQIPCRRNKLLGMLAEPAAAEWTWFCSGREIFPALLAAIDAARESGLPSAFWKPLRAAGGEVRLFNPLALNWLGIRNHRKLLVCDEKVAFVGGFNIASAYDGDGVTRGWFDLGLRVRGTLALQLAATFEEMYARADFQHKRFIRLRRSTARQMLLTPHEQLLLSGPGRGRNPIKQALHRDLAGAANVQIMAAYFLPTWRMRRDLTRIARRGGTVQLILPGKSDVLISQLAGQSLYRRFLKGGVQIHEYQPQILHAKLITIDDIIYVGSANLDPRSLSINYELMVRFKNQGMAAQARAIFAASLAHCRQITKEEWRQSRTIWRRLKQRCAYWLLVRIDPYLARRQWQALPD
ncbi:MAG: phospholipase D-like domain-containing protein [Verrucomicrobia bacterium]|nr:phospholipase D-like domain-containing protein [Verrucomicrobiota bacterium]